MYSGDSNDYTQHPFNEIFPRYMFSWVIERTSKGHNTEFDSAIVNERSAFETLTFNCSMNVLSKNGTNIQNLIKG